MPSEFAHHAALSLFGVRVRVESNSESAIIAAQGRISLGEQADSLNDDQETVYIVLSSYAVNEPRERCADGVNANSLYLAFGQITVRADAESGRGICEFPDDCEFDRVFAEALDTIVLFLVAHAGRIPIHASAFMLQDTAIVLAGPSGSGKSTLALAAAQVGLTVLSEDTVFVQPAPKLRLWSRTEAIHVFEKDAPAEASGAMRYRSGRWKKILPVHKPQNFADKAVLCVLSAGYGLSLTPMAPNDAVTAVTANPEPGFDLYGARSVEAARLLAGHGAWRLTLSKSPRDAIDLIRHIILPGEPG
jgi:hypothetical protein